MSVIPMCYEFRDESALAEHALVQVGWAKELRHLCAMLSHAPEDAMAAVSLTVYPTPGEATCLPLLCRHMAGEYGLTQTVREDDGCYIVRFCRRADRSEEEGGHERSQPGARAD